MSTDYDTELLEGRTIVGEKLVLGPDVTHVLGPDLVLKDCEIVLRTKTSRALQFNRVRFLDCTIRASRALHRCTWRRVELIGCTFVGSFRDNQFGRYLSLWGDFGSIERCDFRNADVAYVRIFGSSIDTLLVPGWPFFVVRTPQMFRERILAVEWPGDLTHWADTLGRQPDETSAVFYQGEELATRFRASTDALREALTALGSDVVLIR